MTATGITEIPSIKTADDESSVYRNSLHPDEQVDNFLCDPVANCWELFLKGVAVKGADQPCLGTRGWTKDGPKGPYQWNTYAQVANLAARLVLNISRYQLCPSITFPPKTRPGYQDSTSLKCLGIYSKNRLEWIVCEQAANIAGITLVPLYDTFGRDALEHIMHQTKLDTIVVSWESFPSLMEILDPKKRLKRSDSSRSFLLDGVETSSTESDDDSIHDLRSQPTPSIHLNVKNVIILPPYPCLLPIHLSSDSQSQSHSHLSNRTISPNPISVALSGTEGVLTPETQDTINDPEATTDSSDSQPADEVNPLDKGASPKKSSATESNLCPDCGLSSGRLWQSQHTSEIEAQLRSAKRACVRVIHWGELMQLPSKNLWSEDLGELAVAVFPTKWFDVWQPVFDINKLKSISQKDTIQTICYTSGTTGYPKGVVITHTNIICICSAALRGPFSQRDIEITEDDCHISYLPLAHIFERVIVNLAIVKGARVGMFGGDVHRLLSDIAVLQPTVFVSVPRVFTKINDKVIAGLKSKSLLSQLLFHFATECKLSNFRRNPHCITHPVWDRLIFNKMKALLGGRIRYLLVGGAPLDPLIQERMTIFFSVPLLQGYGLTEAMGAAFNTRPSDPAGYAGAPFCSVQFKIQSVPELNYSVQDEYPRGELLLQGPSVTAGYFSNEEQTEQLFVDGWLRSGDIVELRHDLGLLRIIDRRKNLFKLIQGEYVAPERLEGVFQQAALVEQLFVFAYSTSSYLVAVVVPDAAAVESWCRLKGFPETPLAELCSSKKSGRGAAVAAELHASVLAQLHYQAKSSRLQGFENVRDIILTAEPFTVENSLLTPTMKLRRHALLQTFKVEIDGMFARTDNLIKEQRRE